MGVADAVSAQAPTLLRRGELDPRDRIPIPKTGAIFVIENEEGRPWYWRVRKAIQTGREDAHATIDALTSREIEDLEAGWYARRAAAELAAFCYAISVWAARIILRRQESRWRWLPGGTERPSPEELDLARALVASVPAEEPAA